MLFLVLYMLLDIGSSVIFLSSGSFRAFVGMTWSPSTKNPYLSALPSSPPTCIAAGPWSPPVFSGKPSSAIAWNEKAVSCFMSPTRHGHTTVMGEGEWHSDSRDLNLSSGWHTNIPSATWITVTKSFMSVYSSDLPNKNKSNLLNLCVWLYSQTLSFAAWSSVFFKTMAFIFWESDIQCFWWICVHVTHSAKDFPWNPFWF